MGVQSILGAFESKMRRVAVDSWNQLLAQWRRDSLAHALSAMIQNHRRCVYEINTNQLSEFAIDVATHASKRYHLMVWVSAVTAAQQERMTAVATVQQDKIITRVISASIHHYVAKAVIVLDCLLLCQQLSQTFNSWRCNMQELALVSAVWHEACASTHNILPLAWVAMLVPIQQAQLRHTIFAFRHFALSQVHSNLLL